MNSACLELQLEVKHGTQKNKLFDILLKKILIECLLFSANAAMFQQYHGENKLIVNEMMTRSALYYTNTLRVGF